MVLFAGMLRYAFDLEMICSFFLFYTVYRGKEKMTRLTGELYLNCNKVHRFVAFQNR